MAPPAPVKWMPTIGVPDSKPGLSTLQSQLLQPSQKASQATPSQAQTSGEATPVLHLGGKTENGDEGKSSLPNATPASIPDKAASTASKAAEQPFQPPALAVEAAVERVEGFMRRLAVEHDKEGFFEHKVSTDLRGCEDYYDRIKHPMWFARIREKLRAREYKTLHQFQLDVELICSNATSFNQKNSRVYKNAQNMLKGCRKQLLIERGMLAEAIHALHPGGIQVALADEAEEEKALKAVLPPKKPPAKPSKVIKPPKKPAGVGASGSSLLRMTSSPQLLTPLTSLAPGADFTHLLGGPGDNDDLLVDVHAEDDFGYSSFSETDTEDLPAQQASKGNLVVERQQWNEASLPSGAAERSAATAHGRSNAWKERRRSVEWRVRWLEHRLREIHSQRQRYASQLGSRREAAAVPEQAVLASSSGRGLDGLPQDQLYSDAGMQRSAEGGPADARAASASVPAEALSGRDAPGRALHPASTGEREKYRRHRRIVQGLAGESLLDHPFFAAQAGLRGNKQVVRDIDEAVAMEEDQDFPARVYAALELLERQMYGLRRQLCEPGTGSGLPRKGYRTASAGRGAVKGPGLKVSQGHSIGGPHPKDGKPSKRRRTGESSGSDFILPGVGTTQSITRVRASKITVPQFHEHSAEELRSRAAILRSLEMREAARAQAQAAGIPPPAPSSSEEDTDDEAFTRLHGVMQEQERAMYAGWTGGAQKKKKKNKTKDEKGEGSPSRTAEQRDVQGATVTNGGLSSAPLSSSLGDGGRQLASPVQVVTVPDASGVATQAIPHGLETQTGASTHEDVEPSSPTEADRESGLDWRGRGIGRRGRPPGGNLRARGRVRARGRPPSSGRALASARPTRLAGPGRGHKNPRPGAEEVAKAATQATAIVASAVPARVVADQPALSGGAADSELTDPHGGIEVPIALAQGQVVQQTGVQSPSADTAAKAVDSAEATPCTTDK